MRFGEQFEFHKIPEWYTFYFNYNHFKKEIEKFKEDRQAGDYIKLPGLYFFLDQKIKIEMLDFERIFKRPGDELHMELSQRRKINSNQQKVRNHVGVEENEQMQRIAIPIDSRGGKRERLPTQSDGLTEQIR